MLIRVRIENFASFFEEVELSMIPGRALKHPEHIIRGAGTQGIDLLKSAVVYGANASGKSNLVKAISLAQELIVDGTRPQQAIARTPFKLKAEALEKPTRFEFEIKVGERAYLYGFSFNNRWILKEWLYKIGKTSETKMFLRTTSNKGKTQVEFGKLAYESKKEADFLEFVAMGTRPNQLFLTESIGKNVDYFRDVYEWFSTRLVVVFPHSRYLKLNTLGKDADLGNLLVRYLNQLGTGICGFELKDISIDSIIPADLLDSLKADLSDQPVEGVFLGPEDQRLLFSYQPDEELAFRKLMFNHRMSDCDDEVIFDMEEESDGTRRLIDLIPGIFGASQQDRVLFIDELDRSLHPQLTYQIMRLFLGNSSSGSQIIATTHEEHLLNLELLRRDEIWFVEKDRNGQSHLYSLEEFAPRYDKDIERGYLMGRFGAIPVFGNLHFHEG